MTSTRWATCPRKSPANHVLLNGYESGQGIMPHVDGDLFLPMISTVNLGSHTALNFYEPEGDSSDKRKSFPERLRFSLIVKPRSLLILKDDLYTEYLHGIEEVGRDVIGERVANAGSLGLKVGESLQRQTRISLTIRNVPKTSKMKIRL